MTLEDFKNKFLVEQYTIYETETWVWSLRPHQATIGSGVLSLKRLCTKFSDLTKEEFTDLNNIIKVIERTLEKAFNYDKINYLMLMMVDNHIHFHVIPRYKDKIFFTGVEWIDEGWPKVPVLSGEQTSKELLDDILKKIKESITLN